MKGTITKTCPDCGRPLVERTNGKTNESFLGCSGWPECKHTEELPLDIVLRRAGQRGLFDDEPPPDLPALGTARRGEYRVPSGADVVYCRSCGQACVWAEGSKGGRLLLSLATVQTRDGVRYAVAHFSDCPQAKEWSKR